MAATVGVVGASGYGGAELVRLLDGHPALELSVVAAHSQAGERVDSLYPNLAGDRRFDPIDTDRLAGLDLVFLATPHGASLELASALLAAGTRVVDLSGAFRLPADLFAQWYGEEHPDPQLAPGVYGLTEFARDEVAAAQLLANPGCYPTAALLGLLPLAGLIDGATVVIDAKSGTSGAGRGLRDNLHFSHVHDDFSAYGAPAHRHTGEIEHWLGVYGGVEPQPLSFTPHLLPIARGLQATSYATLADGLTAKDVQDALMDRYDQEPFVHVLDPGVFPHVKAVAGSNGVQLSALVDPRTRRVVVACVVDNLGKGAAGQALQNANLMLGIEETAGLTAVGMYP